MSVNDSNITESVSAATESLGDLNKRYANALVPLAVWLAVLAVLGVFGNLLVIVVFSYSPGYKNTNFKVFVISLAVIDLLTCVTLVPADIIKTQHYFYFESSATCKIKCFFNLYGQISSAFVLLVICVDRFRKVFSPLKQQIIPGLATRLVLVIMFGSLILSLPGPFLCGISTATAKNIYETNTTVFVCVVEESYRDSLFRKVYKLGLTVTLCGVSIAFLVMYSLIVKIIVRHRKNIGHHGSVRLEQYSKVVEKSKNNDDKNMRNGNYRTPDGDLNACAVKICDAENDPLQVIEQRGLEGVSSLPAQKCSCKRDNRFGTITAMKSCKSVSLKCKVDRRKSSSSSATCNSGGWIPYKTFIWIILTLVYVLTYIIHAVLSFTRTELHSLSPQSLLLFVCFFRIYFVNNVVNPLVYICLDKRFRDSCRRVLDVIKR